jgi:predicted DNA-binding transcriptional regulator AlpA
MNADNDNQPRLLTKKAAATYVGITTPTFSKWVLAGIFPPTVSITRMWDRRAIDAALDKLSGIECSSTEDSFDAWERERDAKKFTRNC